MSIFVDIPIETVISVASILIVLWFESKRKPKLRFSIGEMAEIEPNDPRGLQPAKLPHVYVYNESMPRWLSRAFDRNPALACRGEISFHNLDGQNLFSRPMPVRWANNPEPLVQDPKTGQFTGIDWDKMRVGPLWDIPPGNDPGILNVVYRAKTDPECYGYNNDSYLHNWRNPEWKLDPGQYLAKIVIRTGGQTFTETVQIMNLGYDDFRLELSARKLIGIFAP